MVSERKHFQPNLKPSLFPKPTSANVRKYPKPLRDGTNGNANWFIRGNLPRGISVNPSHSGNQAELSPRISSDSKGISSFFITNFPHDWKAVDLMETFSRYGKVLDVVVPEKRSRTGQKYAFTRFFGIESVFNLEKSLDMIWIGSYKLRVNIAKFQEQVKKITKAFQRGNRIFNPALVKENISFAEVIHCGNANRNYKTESPKPRSHRMKKKGRVYQW